MTQPATLYLHGGTHSQHLERANHHHQVAVRADTHVRLDRAPQGVPTPARAPVVTTCYATLLCAETRLHLAPGQPQLLTHHRWPPDAAALRTCHHLLTAWLNLTATPDELYEIREPTQAQDP